MTPEQILAVKCAYADLSAAQQQENLEYYGADEPHSQTMLALIAAFPDITFNH
jgi:hypothetical protein